VTRMFTSERKPAGPGHMSLQSVSDRSLDDIGGFRDGDRKYENVKVAVSSAVLRHVDQTARWQ